jgi:hypothetical protein
MFSVYASLSTPPIHEVTNTHHPSRSIDLHLPCHHLAPPLLAPPFLPRLRHVRCNTRLLFGTTIPCCRRRRRSPSASTSTCFKYRLRNCVWRLGRLRVAVCRGRHCASKGLLGADAGDIGDAGTGWPGMGNVAKGRKRGQGMAMA